MSNVEHLTAAVVANVSAALAEDLGSGDITADLVGANANARGIVIAREPLTLAGQPWFDEVYRQLDPDVAVEWLFNDGDHVPSMQRSAWYRALLDRS